jgi:hypothetical protein
VIVLQWLAMGLIVLYVVAALVVTLWPAPSRTVLRSNQYRDNQCRACGLGHHADCSGWCFCDCEFNA